MNLGSLNGFAVNSSALAAWVKAALVAASVGCASSAVATYNHRVTSALSAGSAGVAQVTQTQVVTSALSAGGSASASAGTIWGGRSELAAGSFGVSFVYRTIPATVTGAAGAIGTALPNDQLGVAELSAGLDGAASGTKVQFTTAALAAGGDGEARAQFGSPVLGYGTALGLAEASTQLFGETIFTHDGFVLAEAGTTAAVAETHWQRFITSTVTPAAGLSGTAQAYKTHPGHAALSGGVQDATADFRNLLYGETSATFAATGDAVVAVRTQQPGAQLTAGTNALAAAKMTWGGRVAATGVMTSLAPPTRVQPGASTLSAGMDFVSSQFADQYWATASGAVGGDGAASAQVFYRYWATTSSAAGGDGAASALVLQLAGTSGSSDSEAEAAGAMLHAATSSAMLTGMGEATALTNIEVDAPSCRTWTLAAEDRVLWLGHENRTMTPGC
jgi:hypothetical protein